MNVEILSPAGSYESLYAAIRGGANSIYFGAFELNMRSRSSFTFGEKDIYKVAKICGKFGVKSYLALNTVIFSDEIERVRYILDIVKDAGISAVIAGDVAVMIEAKKRAVPVHISVQANIANIEAVRFYSQFADVMVLARELKLEQIRYIVSKIKEENICGPSGNLVRIEIFAHGALCVSFSGKCYMSLAAHNASANRGACFQNCRRAYRVIDESQGNEFIIENQYVMSPKDICLISCLDKILDAGVSILKIEGRGRSTDYVQTVTRVYREALKAIEEGSYNSEKIEGYLKELSGVFNRGFWHGGYYLGEASEMWSGNPDNKADKKKVRAGFVTNYFARAGVAEIGLRENDLHLKEEVMFTGKTTGAFTQKCESIRIDKKDVDCAPKGSIISIRVKEKVRRNDAFYVLKPNP